MEAELISCSRALSVSRVGAQLRCCAPLVLLSTLGLGCGDLEPQRRPVLASQQGDDGIVRVREVTQASEVQGDMLGCATMGSEFHFLTSDSETKTSSLAECLFAALDHLRDTDQQRVLVYVDRSLKAYVYWVHADRRELELLGKCAPGAQEQSGCIDQLVEDARSYTES